MALTVLGAIGFEIKDINMQAPFLIAGTHARMSLDAVNFSPSGGAQSILIDENVANSGAGNNSTEISFPNNPGYAAGSVWCLGTFDFRVPTDAQDCGIFYAVFTGGANPRFPMGLWRDGATKKLHWYGASTDIQGKGSSLGSDGSLTINAGLWHRAWIVCDFQSGTGTITMTAFVTQLSSLGVITPLAADAVGTKTNDSKTTVNPTLGIRTDAVGIPNTLNLDNVATIGGTAQLDARDQILTISQLITITANGTDQGFAVSSGTHWQAVDESPQNGSGTTDSDYLSLTGTASVRETEAVTLPARVAGYDTPECVIFQIWHRNSNAGKWGSLKNPYFYWNGVGRDYTAQFSTYTDPGTSYIAGVTTQQRMILTGQSSSVPIRLSDLTNMEIGVWNQANAAEAALWKISTMAAEITYSRNRSLNPPRTPIRNLLITR